MSTHGTILVRNDKNDQRFTLHAWENGQIFDAARLALAAPLKIARAAEGERSFWQAAFIFDKFKDGLSQEECLEHAKGLSYLNISAGKFAAWMISLQPNVWEPVSDDRSEMEGEMEAQLEIIVSLENNHNGLIQVHSLNPELSVEYILSGEYTLEAFNQISNNSYYVFGDSIYCRFGRALIAACWLHHQEGKFK